MSAPDNHSLTCLVDMGNSRIKVSSIKQPAQLIFSCNRVSELTAWLASNPVSILYCASVRDQTTNNELEYFCDDNAISVNWVETEKHFAGLHNSYKDVSTMGVDRWLSMVACHQHQHAHFAVLMFGTAITCDIVSNGQHLGGWIVPGRQLMQDALTTNTARVFAHGSTATELSLGNSTPACVDVGCFAAASGVVAMAEHYLCSHFDQYCIFLTGGDEKLLTSQKGDAIVRAGNLVLQGLSRYANYR